MLTEKNILNLLGTLKRNAAAKGDGTRQSTDASSNPAPKAYRGRPICVADSETDPFLKGRVPKPFIWGFYNGADYEQFTRTEEFIEFVQDQNIICYAHNAGKFDWHFITPYIPTFEPLTIINGRLAKFKIGECEFRDSFNIIPAPLSAYKKDEIDYSIFEEGERDKPENWTKICAYLKSDCVYLWEMVTQFIDDYGMNLTQAGAAMKFWAQLSNMEKPTSNAMYYEEMKSFYYGGRVECFEKGIINHPFKVIDINSAYPYAMIHEHPWGLNYTTYDHLPKELENDTETLSRCFIRIRGESFGALPYRSKTGLTFPNDNDNRIYDITGWEYIAAKHTGTVGRHDILEVREYHDSINFCGYVNHFFDMKLEASRTGDAARYVFAKLFLNSLYGKFAANPDNYEEFQTVPATSLDDAFADGWTFCQFIDAETAIVNRPILEERKRYYDIAVAASVTGFVRAYLWRSICATDRPLYCDTDSIAAHCVDGMALSDRLGDWDLEAVCDHGAIAGKKLYAFHKENGAWKTASKGVRLSAEEIVRIASGEVVTYHPEVPTFSVKSGVRFTPRKVGMI